MEFEETDIFIKNAYKEGVCAVLVDCSSSTGKGHGVGGKHGENMTRLRNTAATKLDGTDSGEGTSRDNSSCR